MSDIRPIETKYKNYRFRSRLEARWAVFLDAIGVAWEYEKEGYDIDGTWYLPDFWIPYDVPGCREQGWGFWLEIKPTEITDEQIRLFDRLAQLTGHRTYAICGLPTIAQHCVSIFQHYHNGTPKNIPFAIGSFVQVSEFLEIDNGNGKLFVIGSSDIRIARTEDTLPFKTAPLFPMAFCMKSKTALSEAFIAAMAARFEHGETPKIPAM